VRYTESVVRGAVKRYFVYLLRHEVTWTLYIALAGLIAFLIYDFSRGRVSWLDGVVGTVIVLVPVMVWVAYRAHLTQALAKLRHMREPVATFTATKDSLTATSDAGALTLPWRSFKSILDGEGFWVLVLKQRSTITLPLENIEPATLRFLRDQVHEAV
jgi:hypothetical protein